MSGVLERRVIKCCALNANAKLPNINHIPPACIWGCVRSIGVCLGSIGVPVGSVRNFGYQRVCIGNALV